VKNHSHKLGALLAVDAYSMAVTFKNHTKLQSYPLLTFFLILNLFRQKLFITLHYNFLKINLPK